MATDLADAEDYRLEVERLRGLLRQAKDAHNVRGSDGPCDCEQCRAIDAALDGECKHDGGIDFRGHFLKHVREWTPTQEQICRLCGAPASEVK